MHAGNAMATVKSQDSVRVMTFRPTAFEAAATSTFPVEVEPMSTAVYDSAGIEWVSDSEQASDTPQLSNDSHVAISKDATTPIIQIADYGLFLLAHVMLSFVWVPLILK